MSLAARMRVLNEIKAQKDVEAIKAILDKYTSDLDSTELDDVLNELSLDSDWVEEMRAVGCSPEQLKAELGIKFKDSCNCAARK